MCLRASTHSDYSSLDTQCAERGSPTKPKSVLAALCDFAPRLGAHGLAARRRESKSCANH